MPSPIQRKLDQAQRRMQQGDIAGAEQLCEQVLQQAPRNPQALWLKSVAQLMSGRAREAVSALEQLITVSPRHGAALENLGLAHLMLGEYAEAERALRSAAALKGAPASVYMRLGLAILHQGRPKDAIGQLEHALAIDPRDIDARLNLGLGRARCDDMEGAKEAFREVLRQSPGHPDALFNMGVLHLERDEFEPARQWFEQVLAVAPQHADALVNLGIVLRKSGRLAESETCLRRAHAIAPNLHAARDNLAQTLAATGRHAEAREEYLATLQEAPALLSAREGLVAACFALHRYREAIVHLQAILDAEPANVSALSALANALYQAGSLEEAESIAQRAHELDASALAPYGVLAQIYLVRGELERSATILEQCVAATNSPALLGLLMHELRRLCDWERWRPVWDKASRAIAECTDVGSPFYLLCEATTAERQLAYTRAWAQARFGDVTAPVSAHTRPHDRRIRLGYLSSDFYEQPVGYLIAEVMGLHDRSRLEVFAYSYGPDDRSATRARLEKSFEHFVDIAQEPDDVACRRIRNDDIDILVDLHGYTVGDRLTIMAKRPCAIQVTWLGYPCTTGASFIDYLIADPFIIPPGREGDYCSERVLRMPHCYQPNDRERPILASLDRQGYGLPENDFVFCCFNQLFKITPDVFACWMQILHETPGSVLWLLNDHPAASARLRLQAQAHGVSPDRLMFAPRVPLPEHLARYRVADLALDTFPYTSHTTASDALWVGCPLVALCGDTFASRVSGSILTCAGLGDLVAHDLGRYSELVLELAGTPSLLSEVRRRVLDAKVESPLFDMQRFARDLEALYSSLL